MDFILSLTHFCEVHGPTSILCSQIIPTSCSQCYPDSSDSSPNGSPLSSQRTASPASSISHDNQRNAESVKRPSITPELGTTPSSTDGCTTKPTIGPLASPPASAPASAQRIEDHPWFVNGNRGRTDTGKLNRYGGVEGDTCASCRLTLPEDVSKQLPPGSPGTLKDDGKGRNGSPVLRSREMVHSCQGNHFDLDGHDDHDHYDNDTNNNNISHDSSHHFRHSSPSSMRSSYSSDSSCHKHIVTYLSMRGPTNQTDYSLLRRASIRTLSCELLPRGLSSGPLSFGDPVTGYTIAYVFRLPDPMARGKRRSYALVALAGKDASRTFRASPIIWRVFGRIANGIVSAAEKFQELEKRRDSVGSNTTSVNGTNTNTRNYTPISSFLTGRTVDPDGQPRRAGQVRARNLTEIVGNEYIFAEIHAQFVALLQQLGSMFGSNRMLDQHSVSGAFDESNENYLRSDETTSMQRSGRRCDGHSRVNSNSLHPPTGQSPLPKPIPISQRRPVVA